MQHLPAAAQRGRLWRGARLAVLAAGGLVVTACSSGSPGATSSTSTAPIPPAPTPTPPTPAAPAAGPLLTGTISVRGDYWITATFTTHAEVEAGGGRTAAPAAATCADYAKGLGGTGAFVAPEVQATGASDLLYFRSTVDNGYTGPGTYRTTVAPGLDGTAAVTVGTAVGGPVTIYRSNRAGGSATLSVRADGSGSISFADWGSDENRAGISGGSLDGTVDWVCR